ncbi:MAG: VWA domain-containing protein [Myxococcales bacterium]|nr:VWA domain-containing protein [Myxococcales bacterium]
MTRYWVLAGVLSLLALGCSDDGGGAPCVDGDESCGRDCSSLQPCPLGLYCSNDATCAKQCVAGDSCGSGPCTPSGRCPSSTGADNTPDGGFGNTRVPPTDTTVEPPPPADCAETTVHASRVEPTVILIVDQSSSMDDEFEGGRSRWDVLRDFLLGEPEGLIADLQSQVQFGLALYSAESGGDNPDPIGECPMVTTVAPALDNFDAIAQVYRDADVIEDTPTGDSIDAIIEDLGLTTLDPDQQANPIVFILATDGEPDRCEELDPQNGQDEAIAAVERAFQLGIRTLIISVGEGAVSAEHQPDVANAGLGRVAGDPPAEFWVAGDDTTLRAALTDIVGDQLGCEVQLNGRVEGDECLGRVTLNGRDLECGGANGWELTTPRTVRLLGTACDDLKQMDEVLLEVRFPCEVGVVF